MTDSYPYCRIEPNSHWGWHVRLITDPDEEKGHWYRSVDAGSEREAVRAAKKLIAAELSKRESLKRKGFTVRVAD